MNKLLVVLGILATAMLPAQPKVAVLDAVIPQTMDSSVVVPITDKIAEELVNAKKYSVLDRANVEQVLREREFQLSGLVQDNDIKEAGKYLGADYVVVSRVSLVDGTYFISARMINVETGAVEAQVSDQDEGRASVLITIAARVGRKLALGTVEKVVEPPAAADQDAQAVAPPEEPGSAPRLFIGAEVGLPLFLGEYAEMSTAWTDYWTTQAGYFDSGTAGFGLSATVSYKLLGPLYVGASLDYARQSLDYSADTETTFTLFALGASAGAVLPLGPAEVFAGGRVGFGFLSLGEFWRGGTGENWTVDWEGLGSSGLAYGLEAGARLILFNFLTLGARVELLLTSVSGTSDIAFAGFFDTISDAYGFGIFRLHVGAGIALGG